MPGAGIVFLPVFILLAITSALGVGLWLSALAVTYRDVRYTLPFLVQIWMFCSPVIYLSSKVPEKWLWVYALNPMVGVIEGFRWALLKTPVPAYVFLISGSVSIVLLIGGLFYFRRTEKFFADRI
jgi:lipopolysaccharide transport system permease protein